MARPAHPGHIAGLLLVLTGTLPAAPALAQNHAAKDMADQAETLTPDDAEKTRTKPDLLIVPIPMSNPATGTGLALAAVLFYNPNQAPEPWITGVGAAYTESHTKAVAAFHSMSLDDDRFRVLAVGGYADARLKFYGIGGAAGNRDISVDMEDKGALGLAQAQMRLFKHAYFGARFQYLDISSRITVPHPNYPDLDLPPLELNSTLVMVGPAITYDSRDSSTNPRKGVYAVTTWMFGVKAFGGDFTHDRLNAQVNYYAPLGRATTLGLRASICGVEKTVPFYDLCMYGMSSDLRGYETGRYRDRASWAVQAEIRQHLFGNFGGVVFGGVGGVAHRLKDIFGDSTVLPAGGVGLRYRASKSNNVNLRLDFAVGKHSHGIYFGIGEAF